MCDLCRKVDNRVAAGLDDAGRRRLLDEIADAMSVGPQDHFSSAIDKVLGTNPILKDFPDPGLDDERDPELDEAWERNRHE